MWPYLFVHSSIFVSCCLLWVVAAFLEMGLRRQPGMFFDWRVLGSQFNSVYTVYVLRSISNGKLYIGQTSNLPQRLSEHQTNAARYTRGRAFAQQSPLLFIKDDDFLSLGVSRLSNHHSCGVVTLSITSSPSW